MQLSGYVGNFATLITSQISRRPNTIIGAQSEVNEETYQMCQRGEEGCITQIDDEVASQLVRIIANQALAKATPDLNSRTTFVAWQQPEGLDVETSKAVRINLGPVPASPFPEEAPWLVMT